MIIIIIYTQERQSGQWIETNLLHNKPELKWCNRTEMH